VKIKAERTVSGPWHPAIEHAANVTDRVWLAVTGRHARITGLGEEGHSERSLHYGIPGDIRIRAIDVDADDTHVTAQQQAKIDSELRKRLGIEYDIVWEHMGTVNAHLHLEYDPEEVIV
jgi:hypothetical protein